MSRFVRVGLGYRFSPHEVPLVLHFSRIHDDPREFTAQVDVFNVEGGRLFTRHTNLMASPSRGSLKELIDDLDGDCPFPAWKLLLREACQSVMASHRNGRPVEVIMGEIERPPPPEWLCHGLLLKDKPNCWLGAASTGKSTLAKAICAYYASGWRFCDREMGQGVPLYLDWEDDRADFERTVYDICRNLGVWPLPRMLWRDMHGYRLRDQVETLGQIIDREHVGLVVMDAIAAAGGSPGEHMSWEGVALELEQCLGALPPVTVLGLDHVTGADHKARGTVPVKARGAERKVEFFRNQWSLVADDEAAALGRHVVNWTHTKVNVVAKEHPFATEIVHRDAEISIVVRPLTVATAAPEAPEDAASRLLAVLAQTSGRSIRDLCLQIDGHEPSKSRYNSVRTTLDRAVDKGRAWKEKVGSEVRYRTDNRPGQGTLIPFPGAPVSPA